jgi:flagellar motility protein MotE (MotC chaperone)
MIRFLRLIRRGQVMPVTIFAIALLLGLKLVGLGQTIAPVLSMLTDAQAAPVPGAPSPLPSPSPAAVSVPAVTAPAPEPAISAAERQLLQDLRNRHTELDTREHLLQQREAVLDAAEHRLTGRIAEMAALQARLEQLEKARQEHDEANWAGLVKVYETMKPREAAAILNDMDLPVLLEVIDRMKDSKAALVLGAMQPDRARQLTAQLAASRTRSTKVPPGPAG